ncbi:MAG: hypothetical protein GX066_00795 [Clostridiaceae bacterium]|nr:hypothetical protein [Clostridiaceae bacterium]
MKENRVGTVTMAIVLIAFGVIIFVSQISGSTAIHLVFKIWPLMLILLGFEILYYRFLSRDKDAPIKYDIFSIFFVMIILFTNLGLYTLSEIGFIDKLEKIIFRI